MPSVLSNYRGNAALSEMIASGLWLACHTSDPGVTGDPATELAGGGYARQPISFSIPSGKATASTNGQTFTGLPGGIMVTYLAVWDSPVTGNLQFTIELAPPGLVPNESGQILAGPGDIGIQL